MSKSIIFIDFEVGIENKKIHDIGAVREDKAYIHTKSIQDFYEFISDTDYICGHNIIHHDLEYLGDDILKRNNIKAIDTLYLSPLLFPKRPYHALLKDDKLQVDELNNPVNDCKKAANLFYDEVNAFFALPLRLKQIFAILLYGHPEFTAFFEYVDFMPSDINILGLIYNEFKGKICTNINILPLIKNYPVEFAYILALISVEDYNSITPPWLLKNYSRIENIIKYLRANPCKEGCEYCNNKLNINTELKRIFGYDSFRKYNGEALQENAVQKAVDGKSLLAVFPTGGGKSITFQLPAIIIGRAVHGLTVVISPLQSLMKDQVDNLNNIGITEAVTINGLMDPIERANSIERVLGGLATLLYISPEQLRSKTIQKMMISRNIVRFVIDEAHCFSAWGQDFRVDYLYIGDYIRELQDIKIDKKPIPVSCFTATAKQKVISDICEYFKRKLDLDLEIFASSAARENLHYTVLYKETDEEKYNTLRGLLMQKNCPTIIYVSRTKKTGEIAQKLSLDGFKAVAFNGKMEVNEKIENQEAFMRNQKNIMVATSAFGMGVDKKDVKLVIHYDISSSLEDYVQEAGRAGRDPHMQAECYVLYNDRDLDKHFILLNQTKLSISEIQQVWRAIKDLTKVRPRICSSALEIARQAGWDDSVMDVETRVKTAISALETAGYLKRGKNMPHVYATGIIAKNMMEASARIESSSLFTAEERITAKRIIKSLISSRSIAKAGNEAESRVDYLADILGLRKSEVINSINMMRQDGILSDAMDMSVYIPISDTENKTLNILEKFSKLEFFILNKLIKQESEFNLKELNEEAQNQGISSSNIKNIRTIIYFYAIKNFIKKSEYGGTLIVNMIPMLEKSKLLDKYNNKIEICKFIINYLFNTPEEDIQYGEEGRTIIFSLVSLYNSYKDKPRLQFSQTNVVLSDIEDALLYLSKIGALKLEGGFLVIYNGMEIRRIIKDSRIRYKLEDYRFLDEFYKQKIRQIHIVGEYANLMVKDYNAALEFVQDYFQMDFRKFISKYFQGERVKEIDRNITPEKYNQIFGGLSDTQSEIIMDKGSKYIVAAAGPGSGKTRVLVHKLASLLLLEDVKHEQLLMLTFSRAAATEFKKRLIDLIGNAANFIEIKTFHSYAFDLIGKIGKLEALENVVKNATQMIENGEIDQGKITKSVVVIDEAQDMDKDEFDMILSLMKNNEEMRLIAVGDDDQNIYEFRGSDSEYFCSLISKYGATKYEMIENYRSRPEIISFANSFVKTIDSRMKSNLIRPVYNDKGIVDITYYNTGNMYEAIVKQLINTYENKRVCVLTNTNDEALQLYGMLMKNDLNAKLLNTLNGFKLSNLVEVRFLLDEIERSLKGPIISGEIWNKSKESMRRKYYKSKALEICNNLVAGFESVNSVKYYSDLREFINESNYEDFYNEGNETIYVSTIHKAKGKEFDKIYLMLRKNTTGFNTDEDKRKLYVAITRAKEELYIHTDTDLFSSYQLEGILKHKDDSLYNMPTEISLQLTHKDVVLDFFKIRDDCIKNLYSGMSLYPEDTYLCTRLYNRNIKVLKFSKACRDKIERLRNKGYSIYGADIQFILFWKGEDDVKESRIILPNVYMRKEN